MRNLFIVFIAFCLFSFTGCERNDTESDDGYIYLVDKIYDYHNNLIGDYTYDAENRLVKIMMYFYDTKEGRQIDYDFSYESNRVINIRYTEYREPQFNHDIRLIYNNLGQIIKTETYLINKDVILKHQYFKYSENNNLESISSDEGENFYFFFYDDRKNVVKIKYLVQEEITGDIIEFYKYFTYDNMPKPNFGIDNLFMIEPYPWITAEALERRLSANNMTEALEGKTKWIYTYNENNFPQTIEMKWVDIETEYPMIQKFKYKKVKQHNKTNRT